MQILTFIVCLIFPAFLFDVNLHYSIGNYGAYIGPANAVMGGHLPLVDIHCQYGLSYLIFAFVFKFLLPLSYTAAAAIVSFLDVVFYVIYLLIIRKISKENISIIALGLLTLLFFKLVLPYNIVYTPSVAGFRFIPPLLLLFALTTLPERRILNLWTSVALLLCILWSFEVLLYGVITYAAFIIFYGLLNKEGMRKITKYIGILAVACLGVHMLLALLLSALGNGKFPDYLVYFDMIGAHTESTGKESWSWSALVDPTWLIWVLFFTVYALVLIYSLQCITKGKAMYKSFCADERFLKIIFPAAILGILEMTYFLGRSIWAVLFCTSFPFFIIIIASIANLWEKRSNLVKDKKSQHSLFYASIVITMFLIIPAMTGFIVDRFAQPFKPASSNSTLLRTFWGKEAFASNITQSPLGNMVKKKDDKWKVDFTGYPDWYREQFEEAKIMMDRWMYNEHDVLMFLPQTTELLFLSAKVHKYPISNNVNDQLSNRLIRKIVNSEVSISEGDVIVTTDAISRLASEAVSSPPVTVGKIYNLPAGHGHWWKTDYLILHKIMQSWDLHIVDKSKHIIVCRVTKKNSRLSSADIFRLSLE